VLELESDLRTATTDLATNQLQVVTEEALRLQNSTAKLSQDLQGKLDDPPILA
jgi:uncharacterized protein YoxC